MARSILPHPEAYMAQSPARSGTPASEKRASAAAATTPGFILLMRHGSRRHSAYAKEETQRLTVEGERGVEEAAGALCGLLEAPEGAEQLHLGVVLAGSYGPTQVTASIVVKVLAAREHAVRLDDPWDVLDPEKFWSSDGTGPDGNPVAEVLRRRLETVCGDGANALLVVGHQPQLGGIAEALSGRAEVIGAAEIICLRIEKGAPKSKDEFRLHWAITPSKVDAEAASELRDKIKAKMDAAKLLGSIVLTGMGWLVGKLFDASLGSPFASSRAFLYVATIFCLLVALILCLSTLSAYDTLLMPARFWVERSRRPKAAGKLRIRIEQGGRFVAERVRGWSRRVGWLDRLSLSVTRRFRRETLRRPPSSANRILQQSMVCVWERQFVPATTTVLLGLALLALAAFLPDHEYRMLPVGKAATFAGVLVVGALVRKVIVSSRPALGVQD